ncbi:MAG: ion transporter [Myxococcales bacterium]|nr:ion transporter [Myxococcales bacterium]
MRNPEDPTTDVPWREGVRIIIFGTDTPAGKAFDVALLVAILASVSAVMLESVASVRARYGTALDIAEWGFTLLFTVEYAVRLACVPLPARYARSFFGVVDLLAVLPSYLSLLLPGAEHLLVIRGLRLLRIFRVFKLAQFLGEASVLSRALADSRHKVIVFLGTITILVTILGTAMYLIEGEAHGFTSIPTSVYWAVVTMTTVGYGDLAPQTIAGKTLATVVMILGYSIIAVPTGIVTAEIVGTAAADRRLMSRRCFECLAEGHERDARYCNQCGAPLEKLVVEAQ